MCHTMAPVVLPEGISERSTNQPFCARSRPSNSMRLAVSDSTLTRASGSSIPRVMLLPSANGSGCVYPLALSQSSR